MAPVFEAADRIVERAKRGVPSGRHIMQNEELPFICAYEVAMDALRDCAEFMAEQHAREIEGMGLGPTKPTR